MKYYIQGTDLTWYFRLYFYQILITNHYKYYFNNTKNLDFDWQIVLIKNRLLL